MMDINDQTIAAIELCRRINRSAAGQYQARGIEQPDVAIAAIYSAYDLAAEMHQGDGHGAIEWMRSALDLMERQIVERSAAN